MPEAAHASSARPASSAPPRLPSLPPSSWRSASPPLRSRSSMSGGGGCCGPLPPPKPPPPGLPPPEGRPHGPCPPLSLPQLIWKIAMTHYIYPCMAALTSDDIRKPAVWNREPVENVRAVV